MEYILHTGYYDCSKKTSEFKRPIMCLILLGTYFQVFKFTNPLAVIWNVKIFRCTFSYYNEEISNINTVLKTVYFQYT